MNTSIFWHIIHSTERNRTSTAALVLALSPSLFSISPTYAATEAQTQLHTLTINKAGNGQGSITATGAAGTQMHCGQTCSQTYSAGTQVILTAVPGSDSTFTGWSGNCSGTALQTAVNLIQETTCQANFSLTAAQSGVSLSVLKTGTGSGIVTAPPGLNNGIYCGPICSENYSAGTVVTLSTIPSADSVFVGWSAQCSQGTVALSSPSTCTVTFDALPVTASQSYLQFAISSYAVNEVDGKALIVVTRTAQREGAVTVDYRSLDGTAVAGQDYAAVNGTLTWASGDMQHKVIEVRILPNSLTKIGATFTLELFNPTGGALLGASSQATITIADTPSSGAGSLEFTTTEFTAREDAGSTTITVNRIGGSVGDVSVTYTTQDISALAGQDYISTTGTLSWMDGDSQTQQFKIPILPDTVVEPTETLTVQLSNPTGGAYLGATANSTLRLIDSMGNSDTLSAAGVLQFELPNYVSNEANSLAIVEVLRLQGSQGAIQVQYHTQDGTATAGNDYIAQSGILTWADGDVSKQEIAIPLVKDNVTEGAEGFNIVLSKPSGGASLGTIPLTIVSISDNTDSSDETGNHADQAGYLQFNAKEYQVAESGGSITLTVTRTQGSRGTVRVSYVTQDESAVTGKDYISTQGTLQWLEGETGEKTITIGLYDNAVQTDSKTLKVKLFEPQGGAQLGEASIATVTMMDDDGIVVSLTADSFAADENATAATVSLRREGSAIGQVTVAYETTDGTATAGQDYTATAGMVTWMNGDAKDKTVSILLQDDRLEEGNETLQLKLTQIFGNAVLGEPNEATVTIVENDPGKCSPAPVIDCYLNNKGTLKAVKITTFGTVSGGYLSGDIQSEGVVQNVTLLPRSTVTGGIARGEISSDPTFPGRLKNVVVPAKTILSNIIIGRDSQLDSQVELLEGVLFEDNGDIPSYPHSVSLVNILGRAQESVFAMRGTLLQGDVLLNSAIEGILGAINALPQLSQSQTVLKQNPLNAYLSTEIGDYTYVALPIQVEQVLKIQAETKVRMGMTLNPDGQVTFITHTGRQIKAYPVLQNPPAFLKGLAAFNLSVVTMQPNGNLRILASNNTYYSARPELFSTTAPLGTGEGFYSVTSRWSPTIGTLYLVYTDAQGRLRQQYIYPAAVDPDALYALSTETPVEIHNDGRVRANAGVGKRTYQGILDYGVTTGTPNNEGKVQFLDTPDYNNDGLTDYIIVYPNGDKQILFNCSGCW